MQIDNIINKYITTKDTDYAIMIDGQWGAGKSWYWENKLTKMISNTRLPNNAPGEDKRYKVATISLFGITSIDDLKMAIFGETSQFFKDKYVRTGVKLFGFAINKVASVFSVSETSKKDVAELFSEFSLDLSEYVLCFDDLERVNISLLIDVLGYINTLVEKDHVKVVLVCNEDEIHSDEYDLYKEKVVRFTHTIQSDISEMVETFAQSKGDALKEYLIKKCPFIESIYANGDCCNLRTLKYNLDVFEQVFDIVRCTVDYNSIEDISNYMMLISAMYCIEYRRDNKEEQLRSLLVYNRQWSYQIDAFDSLNRYLSDKNNSEKSNQPEDPTFEYQKATKQRYFRNTYIYGSSPAIVEYLLTGYLDVDKLKADIKLIETESGKYKQSEAKQLFDKLTNFWDTDDEDMRAAVARTIQCVKALDFNLVDYPTFFLCLQRLSNFSFADLGMPIADLMQLFEGAINAYPHNDFIPDMQSSYDNNSEIATPEYKALIEKVTEKNLKVYQDDKQKKFREILNNPNSMANLKEFQGQSCNLFEGVSAEEFLTYFLSSHNSRKRDFWNFFDFRYGCKDLYQLEKTFADDLIRVFTEYVSNPNTPASGSKVYAKKVLEMLQKKVKRNTDNVKA